MSAWIFVRIAREGKTDMDIIGNKVVLRAMEEQDREMLLNLIQDPDVTKITGGYPQPVSYERQMSWFRSVSNSSRILHRIITDKENPRIGLGIMILSNINSGNGTAKIYIKLIKSARRKGYGQDAVNTLVSYAFHELQLECIHSYILESNEASRGLFEKCGFKQEEIRTGREDNDRNSRNLYIYSKFSTGL